MAGSYTMGLTIRDRELRSRSSAKNAVSCAQRPWMSELTRRPNVSAANEEEADTALRHLADTMPQIVWITRPDRYHLYYNAYWWKYTGLTYEEARDNQRTGRIVPGRSHLRFAHSANDFSPAES